MSIPIGGNPRHVLTSEITNQLEKMKRELEELKTPVRGAIIGASGGGKSTLINSIVGRPVAKVDCIECTMVPEHFEIKVGAGEGTLLLTDLPGCGTPNFRTSEYLKKFEIETTYDFCIYVVSTRIKEDDVDLVNALKKMGKPFFLVNSKMDEAVKTGERNGESQQEVFSKITKYFQDKYGSDTKPYLISGHEPDKYDHPRLINDIAKSLPGLKSVRFRAIAKAWTEEAVKAKRAAVEKIVSLYACLAAANGAIPLPGMSVGLDLAILLQMSREVAHAYGLDSESLSELQKKSGLKSAAIALLKQRIGNLINRYLTREGIIYLLRRFGAAEAVKELTKWIPLVGQLISAGLGYQITLSFGEDLINNCEKAALETLLVTLDDVAKEPETKAS